MLESNFLTLLKDTRNFLYTYVLVTYLSMTFYKYRYVSKLIFRQVNIFDV